MMSAPLGRRFKSAWPRADGTTTNGPCMILV